MRKSIGKVILDYSFYEGEDRYSDGEIENVILDAFKNGSSDQLLRTSNQWAVLYHLSDIRENLLEWYPFEQNGSLLEVGSGCGALTGLFSKKVKKVTCIELSEKRSLINAERNRERENIEIKIGNFEDIRLDEKFDYITLIGVWEYAGHYIGGKSPYLDMLKKLKQYLKEDGKLIIAIENKMGLKYWNGAPEDHTGNIYDGLNDYIDADNVRTFSKTEMENMLTQAGWSRWKFYYPMPDYKLPETIYTDDKLPEPGELRNYRKDYNASRIYNFYDAVVSDQLCADKMMDYFANSFLVECGDDVSDIIFAKCNRMRNEAYKNATVISKKDNRKTVQKIALNTAAQKHICQMSANHIEDCMNVKSLQGRIENVRYVTDYVEGQDMDVYLYPYRNDTEKFVEEVQEIVRQYLTPRKECMTGFVMTDKFREIFGEQYPSGAECLKVTNIDLIFSNLRRTKEGQVYCIDNEWVFDFPVPYEFALWKALVNLYTKYVVYLRKNISREQFLNQFNIDKENADIYENMNNCFCNYVLGKDYTENYTRPVMTYHFKFT